MRISCVYEGLNEKREKFHSHKDFTSIEEKHFMHMKKSEIDFSLLIPGLGDLPFTFLNGQVEKYS